MSPEEQARRSGGSAGFTLVEITIATFVLAISALLFAGAISTSFTADAFARERAIAVHAAQAKIEPLISQPDQPAFSLPTLLLCDGTTFPVEGLTGPGGAPPGRVSIDATSLPLINVGVQVSWVGPLGVSSVTLSSTVITAALP